MLSMNTTSKKGQLSSSSQCCVQYKAQAQDRSLATSKLRVNASDDRSFEAPSCNRLRVPLTGTLSGHRAPSLGAITELQAVVDILKGLILVDPQLQCTLVQCLTLVARLMKRNANGGSKVRRWLRRRPTYAAITPESSSLWSSSSASAFLSWLARATSVWIGKGLPMYQTLKVANCEQT